MDEQWVKFQALGQQMEEHNFRLESISPPRSRVPQTLTPYDDPATPGLRVKSTSRLSDVSMTEQKLIDLSRDIRERDRQIAGLMRDVAGLEAYKAQCLNLKSQVQVLNDKNRLLESELEASPQSPQQTAYEQEIESLHKALVGVKNESQELKQELKQREARMHELKLALESKDHLYEIAQQMKEGLEKNIETITVANASQQEQLVTYTQILREKEVFVETLEEDNGKLRNELQKALEGLQQCQLELKFMGKLRGELQHSNQVLTSVEQQLEQEQVQLTAVLHENEELKVVLEDLRRKTNGSDPETFIDLLKHQIEEHQRLNAKSQEEERVSEQKLVDLEKRMAAAKRGLKSYFEKLLPWLDTFTLASGSQPLPTAILPDSYKDLTRYIDACHEMLEKAKAETVKRLGDMETINGELSERNEFFEHSTSELRTKIEVFSQQVEQQEALSRHMIQEKETTERHFSEKYLKCKSKKKALKADVALWRSDFQAFIGNTKAVLEQATQLGFTYEFSSEPKIYLNDVKDCLLHLSSTLSQSLDDKESLQLDLEHATHKAEEETRNLNDCTQEYMTRVQEMSRKINALTETVSANERNSREILDRYSELKQKYDFYQNEKREIDRKIEDWDKTVQTNIEFSTQMKGLTISCLSTLLWIRDDYSTMKRLYRMQSTSLETSRKLLMKIIPKPVSESHPLLKLRKCIIAVFAGNRLLKMVKYGENLKFRGLKLRSPAVNFDFAQDFLSEIKLSEPMTGNLPHSLAFSLMKTLQNLGLRHYPLALSLLEVSGGMEEYVQKIVSISQQKVKE